jgi:hypothetical protein
MSHPVIGYSPGRKPGVPAQYAHLPVVFHSISEAAKLRRARAARAALGPLRSPSFAPSPERITGSESPSRRSARLPKVKSKPIAMLAEVVTISKGTKSRPAPPAQLGPPPVSPPRTTRSSMGISKKKKLEACYEQLDDDEDKADEADERGAQRANPKTGGSKTGSFNRQYAEGEVCFVLLSTSTLLAPSRVRSHETDMTDPHHARCLGRCATHNEGSTCQH